ncbi:MAG: pyridoxal-phosphate dependent enzyme [Thermoplasmata archaeon]|jgi:threonine dehydratase|nr:pyridoxal-phosphate dependent enzyme [Thermoplasmata archaeon]
MTISPADVLKARKALVGRIERTPLTRSAGLSEVSGAEVHIKWENLQRTGSYKPRGALYRMSLLTKEEREKGVITASAGNWALGVALAARSMGVEAKICVPANTPNVKVDRCRALGAEMVLHGSYFDEAFAHAQELVKREGRIYVSGTDDYSVFAGHGTVGLEITEELPEVEKVIVPIGGGGLMTGIACWMKGVDPRLKAIGAQSTATRTMYECFRAKRLVDVPVPPTICEGLAGGITQLNLDLALRYVDDVVLADEGALKDAIIWTMRNERQIPEGSGVVGIAAILQGKVSLSRDEKVAVVVSGGNIDLDRIGIKG